MTDTTGTEANAAERDAYFIGGGIASLAGAAFLLRDAEIPSENVHVLEERQAFGGTPDERGTPEEGYVLPDGRMFNFPTYRCTWNLFRSILLLEDPDTAIKEEMDEFGEKHETYAEARLVGADQEILDVSSYGFETQHHLSLLRLLLTPEGRLSEIRVEEWFDETFFGTTFWYLWATTFAFQSWHSVAEMRRYIQRFTWEFPRLHMLSGVSRTEYNQYDSVTRPLRHWLEARGVNFLGGHTVTDLNIIPARAGKTVEAIRYENQDGSADTIVVELTDVIFVTNESMVDMLSLESMTRVPDLHDSGTSFELWKALADDFPEFGRPSMFADHMPESMWESFTLTPREPDFLEHVVKVTREEPGSVLVTFTESNWLLSITTAIQPHFANQPDNMGVIWGYGLLPEEHESHMNKKMEDCTDEEALAGLYHYLGYTNRLEELHGAATCIPCTMPFITNQFMPRTPGGRPEIIPAGSNNLAFLGQFAEVPDDVVFTVECSVRSALMAVHRLFDTEDDVPPVSTHQYEPDMLLDTVRTTLKQRPRRRCWLGFGGRLQPLAFELLDGDICVRNEPNRRRWNQLPVVREVDAPFLTTDGFRTLPKLRELVGAVVTLLPIDNLGDWFWCATCVQQHRDWIEPAVDPLSARWGAWG